MDQSGETILRLRAEKRELELQNRALEARIEILSRKPLNIGLDNEGWRDGEHCVCNFDPNSPKVRSVCQFHETIYKEWAQAKDKVEAMDRLLGEARKTALLEAAKEVCVYCRAHVSHDPVRFDGNLWVHRWKEDQTYDVECQGQAILRLIEKRVEPQHKKECCCQEYGKHGEKEFCPGCPVHAENPKHED